MEASRRRADGGEQVASRWQCSGISHSERVCRKPIDVIIVLSNSIGAS